MRPVTVRWARIGPRTPSWMTHTPPAGLCLSAFIVARKGDSILLGRPKAHDAWPEKGGFPKRHAGEIGKEGAWLLPATHLLMEEPPDHAARRIAHEWAGITGTPRFLMVQSHVRPQTPGHPGYKRSGRKFRHWDICFVYEMRIRQLLKLRPWWSEMRLFPIAKVRKAKLARGHRDVLERAGYL
jgi:ADP-ribose pyrophosphatase YjhB (NUDIX family)